MGAQANHMAARPGLMQGEWADGDGQRGLGMGFVSVPSRASPWPGAALSRFPQIRKAAGQSAGSDPLCVTTPNPPVAYLPRDHSPISRPRRAYLDHC